MEAAFRTPLLDFFRRGEVARDIRLLAARGALAPRAHEQLGLLVLLVADSDPEVAREAEATLQAIPRESLTAFLARSDVSTELISFFAARGIEPAGTAAPDANEPFVVVDPEPEPDAAQAAAPEDPEAAQRSALSKISSMNVPQRLALATKGSREERAILIRDPNKLISTAVLSSPKLTQSEVESIARMTSISDEILRIIASSRAWMKSYAVVYALAKNPKTPVPVSMNLLARLTEKDLRTLSTDRNIPDVLRITARKKIVIDK
jgi:hypothetical protein